MCILDGPAIAGSINKTSGGSISPKVSVLWRARSMVFSPNDSPLAGREGTQLTGSKIGERLAAEAATSVSLRVVPMDGGGEAFEVQARGELQLGLLIGAPRSVFVAIFLCQRADALVVRSYELHWTLDWFDNERSVSLAKLFAQLLIGSKPLRNNRVEGHGGCLKLQ